NNKEFLLKEFEEQFEKYCYENNIVSEFVRFHPVIQNVQDFSDIYDVNSIRNTVGTNLKDYEDPFQEEFSKSCRKNVRRALRNDVGYKITEKPNDIKSFLEIYYSKMYRKDAQDYYNFVNYYFDNYLLYISDIHNLVYS